MIKSTMAFVSGRSLGFIGGTVGLILFSIDYFKKVCSRVLSASNSILKHSSLTLIRLASSGSSAEVS